MKTAILIGASGLVGSYVLENLLSDSRYNKIVIFVRRSANLNHKKLEEHLVDFNDITSWQHLLVGDDLYSTMGTTIKKAGSEEAQRTVDYTYPYIIAKRAKLNGVKNYALVSSAGADANSRFFYPKIKGELDRDVSQLFFRKTIIVRPSIIDGPRKEKRLGEEIGLKVMRSIKFIPIIKKYQPTPVNQIAQCMIEAVNDNKISGKKIFTWIQIIKYLENT